MALAFGLAGLVFGGCDFVRALGFGPNDTILAPDYHSGNEVGAMRASGVRPLFYRINRRLEPDLEQIERLSRSGVRALFAEAGWRA